MRPKIQHTLAAAKPRRKARQAFTWANNRATADFNRGLRVGVGQSIEASDPTLRERTIAYTTDEIARLVGRAIAHELTQQMEKSAENWVAIRAAAETMAKAVTPDPHSLHLNIDRGRDYSRGGETFYRFHLESVHFHYQLPRYF